MKIKLPGCLFVLALCLAAMSKSFAQDTTVVKNTWYYLLQVYAMFPGMEGTIGLGELPDASINASTDDIFNNLQFSAMLYFEAHNDRWAITSDIIYMHLEQEVAGKGGIVKGKAGAKQFVWEAAGLRKIKPWFDAGIGLRLVNISSSLNLEVDSTAAGGGNKSRSISKTWVDPIIIGRLKLPAGNRWLFQLRADVGGFGIGSDFAWQAQADVYYSFFKLFRLGLGYRIIGIDYEKGTGNDRFLYDVDTYGMSLKFGLNF